MKKILYIVLSVTAAALLVVGCGGERSVSRDAPAEVAEESQNGNPDTSAVASLADGWYRAEESFDPDSDWRNIVMLEVRDGKIIGGTWNAAPKRGGADKLTYSRDGDYNMERVAQWPWHEQSEATVAHLIETQDPYDIEWNDDGEADAVSGATMTVSYFFELAQEALSSDPVERGPYRDGAYTAQGSAGDEWQDTVHVTVIDGYIASVFWAPEPTADQGMNKYDYSYEGEYGMESLSQWPWHEHADAVARFVLANQSLEGMDLDEDGDTDAVSGATISLDGFYAAADSALANAR